jgi:4-alpha-glucanotransferase
VAAVDPVWEHAEYRAAVAEALQLLGVSRLVLAIHDASFPAGADDLGRGTPYSAAGHEFLRFVRQLGFTDVQLGPQGWISRENPSPYDAMIFSRNPLAIALGPLWTTAAGDWRAIVGDVPAESARLCDHRGAWDRHAAALASLLRARGDEWAGAIAEFTRSAGAWLARDERTGAIAPERHRAEQWLAHRQHHELRAFTRTLGLGLFGDLQVGVSHRDRLALASLFLDGYRMGAPPSRTNPDGQPWGYPLLDPAQVSGPEGAAGSLFDARVAKLLDEYDGLRIDHPHGLVDPWVYRADAPDAMAAVQSGARLFSSPDLPDHPELARWAIARPAELDRSRARHADEWVRTLDDAQVARYGALFDRILAPARARKSELVCEVLSTWPHPLRRVMERDNLGRMVVTQKARLAVPDDVYRSDNAQPRDWIMVGNHDTPPLWRLVDDWRADRTQAAERAHFLAERLEPDPAARPAFAQRLATSSGALATAMFAELFASPARHVSIFFADLLGYRSMYNAPGTVSEDNWRLRVAPDYVARYRSDISADIAAGTSAELSADLSTAGGTGEPRALSLPRALAMALRADRERARAHAALVARLDRLDEQPAAPLR